MARYEALLQPFHLRHLVLRNRIMSTSHAPAYVEDAKPKQRYQLYHEEKAKGGIALTMFGGSSNVAPDSPSAFGQIYVGDDSIIPIFQEFAARIHRHGAALMCQLTHMGRRTFWHTEHWLPPIAPSCVREPAHRSFPKEMELADIERVIKAYGAAARRCKEGGLDGCELLASSHLIEQFWSPLVNHRTDRYGGSLENRMRFGFEVLEEVRRQVGKDFIVGMRLSGDEAAEGGLDADQCLEIARAYAASGMLDYLNVIGGHGATHAGIAWVVPGMAYPGAPHLHLAARIKAATGLPVFHAGRIADLATADRAVREGLVDMVGMTRAHMADPHIVAKLRRGEEERIRPCVGAGYCIDRIYEGGEALCIHNPATGREATMPHVIPRSDGPRCRIVVVGAGPAGLEAARVSAARGHDVVLFEATGEVGGQINLAARATWRRDLIGIARWLGDEVRRLGVDLRFNVYAEAEDVLAEGPDVAIIATGGVPNTSFIDGAEHVVSVWDVLGGQVEARGEVLLFDDNGQHQGPSCAEFMAARGARVELVTPDRTVAEEMGATNFPIYLRNLYNAGVSMTPNERLIAVRRDGNRLLATLRNEYTGQISERVVDQVVVEHGTLPAADVYFALKPHSSNLGEVDIDALIRGRPQALIRNPDGRFQLFRVGDAVASRNIHAAIYDALRLCKDL